MESGVGKSAYAQNFLNQASTHDENRHQGERSERSNLEADYVWRASTARQHVSEETVR